MLEVINMIKRVNKHCAYFPCHEGLGDCTFCYCPYYPCGDEHLGEYVKGKHDRRVWSCQDCNWIHDKKVVDRIFIAIRSWGIKERFDGHGSIIGGDLRKTGIIILGHGSRLKRANDTLRNVAAKIRSGNGLDIVEPAFLQLCAPGLQDVIKKILKKGCRRIMIVPYFLFVGNHVTRDIPKIIAQEKKLHKDVEFVYTKNLGQDPRISSIVMDRIREAAL